jgi:hypothetical protein
LECDPDEERLTGIDMCEKPGSVEVKTAMTGREPNIGPITGMSQVKREGLGVSSMRPEQSPEGNGVVRGTGESRKASLGPVEVWATKQKDNPEKDSGMKLLL